MHDTRQNPPSLLPPALAGDLERAAGSIARLDAALATHPLCPAWAWRARLEAIRDQAAVDGKAIDPWHLAAIVEGVRFRLDHLPAPLDRGMVFAAAQHAFGLYRWFVNPDPAQRAATGQAAAHLAAAGDPHAPLLGVAFAVHAWLDHGGERPPLRAALAAYWQHRGVTALPCPMLTGAAALGAEIPWAREAWIGHFLAALAAEAEAGLALLGRLERHWFAARAAVAGRRRDSRAAAAIDILAAAPLLSATALGQALGMATNNATRLLDGFVRLGIVSELTHRSKRRLYGLTDLAPLREAAAPPRRPLPGRRPGRPSAAARAEAPEYDAADPAPVLASSPPLAREPGIRVQRARPLARPRRSGDPTRATGTRTASHFAQAAWGFISGHHRGADSVEGRRGDARVVLLSSGNIIVALTGCNYVWDCLECPGCPWRSGQLGRAARHVRIGSIASSGNEGHVGFSVGTRVN